MHKAIIKTIIVLASLSSCKNRDKEIRIEETEQKNIIETLQIKTRVVDYKRNIYKISLGENYKLSEKVIDWNWAALEDKDSRIDSTSVDAFLYLGEPLICYNEGEWLPALHIETDRNIITSFTCSILFVLEDNSKGIDNFFRIICNDLNMLKNDSVVNSIKSTGVYENILNEYTETYKLKRAKELEYDKFEYTITVKNK